MASILNHPWAKKGSLAAGAAALACVAALAPRAPAPAPSATDAEAMEFAALAAGQLMSVPAKGQQAALDSGLALMEPAAREAFESSLRDSGLPAAAALAGSGFSERLGPPSLAWRSAWHGKTRWRVDFAGERSGAGSAPAEPQTLSIEVADEGQGKLAIDRLSATSP